MNMAAKDKVNTLTGDEVNAAIADAAAAAANANLDAKKPFLIARMLAGVTSHKRATLFNAMVGYAVLYNGVPSSGGALRWGYGAGRIERGEEGSVLLDPGARCARVTFP